MLPRLSENLIFPDVTIKPSQPKFNFRAEYELGIDIIPNPVLRLDGIKYVFYYGQWILYLNGKMTEEISVMEVRSSAENMLEIGGGKARRPTIPNVVKKVTQSTSYTPGNQNEPGNSTPYRINQKQLTPTINKSIHALTKPKTVDTNSKVRPILRTKSYTQAVANSNDHSAIKFSPNVEDLEIASTFISKRVPKTTNVRGFDDFNLRNIHNEVGTERVASKIAEKKTPKIERQVFEYNDWRKNSKQTAPKTIDEELEDLTKQTFAKLDQYLDRKNRRGHSKRRKKKFNADGTMYQSENEEYVSNSASDSPQTMDWNTSIVHQDNRPPQGAQETAPKFLHPSSAVQSKQTLPHGPVHSYSSLSGKSREQLRSEIFPSRSQTPRQYGYRPSNVKQFAHIGVNTSEQKVLPASEAPKVDHPVYKTTVESGIRRIKQIVRPMVPRERRSAIHDLSATPSGAQQIQDDAAGRGTGQELFVKKNENNAIEPEKKSSDSLTQKYSSLIRKSLFDLEQERTTTDSSPQVAQTYSHSVMSAARGPSPSEIEAANSYNGPSGRKTSGSSLTRSQMSETNENSEPQIRRNKRVHSEAGQSMTDREKQLLSSYRRNRSLARSLRKEQHPDIDEEEDEFGSIRQTTRTHYMPQRGRDYSLPGQKRATTERKFTLTKK